MSLKCCLAVLFVLCAGAPLAQAQSTGLAAPPDPFLEEPLPISPAVSAPRLGGYIQVRETLQNRVGLTGLVNRARLSADGALPSQFTYRVLVEYEAVGPAGAASTVSLRDAYIRWSMAPLAITAGQYKVAFSRQYITSITAIELADRAAVVDALAPKRDIGVMAECALSSLGTVSLGVFNGEGQNASSNKDSTAMLVGRLTARPISEVSLGGNFASYGSDSVRYGLEANLDYRGALLRVEAIGQHYGYRPRPADYGWYALAAYRVNPWLQLVASEEDFRRPAAGSTNRNTATIAGANVEFAPNRVRLLCNYVSRKLSTAAPRKASLVTQLQVRF
jgi:hypothetical protein